MSKESQFKQTEIGSIPEDWEVQEFSLILDGSLRNGLTKPTSVRGKGVKMVNMGELFQYDRIKNVEMERVQLSETERKTYLLQSGDLLFARQSLLLSGVGKCSIFLGDAEDVTFEGHLIRARINKSANPTFFYYFFCSRMGRNMIEGYAEQVAAAGVRGSDLKKVPVIVPPLRDQTAIASILSNLDSKIEHNQEMNKTLEAVGQAVFKRWFVDFEFPNEEGKPYKSSGGVMIDSELGQIPDGWHIEELGELVEIVAETVMPQESPEVSFLHYSIPAYDESERPVLNNGQEIKSMKFLIDNESVLVSKLNPERMRIWLPFVKENDKAICSTEFIIYRARKGLSRVFIYFVVKTNQFSDFFSSLVTGSTGSRQRVPPKDTLSYKIAFPKEELLVRQFCQTIDPLIKMRGLNIDQIGFLSKIRDLLLPKLMSGKIRVPVTKEKVEA